MGRLLLNIDVPELDSAVAFYTQAVRLELRRYLFGHSVAELEGAGVAVFLLLKPAGSIGAGGQPRDYGRHWTPVHFDLVVDDLEAALRRALDAGAVAESGIESAAWGRQVRLADPYGHGFCLVEFSATGYASVADG